MHYTRHSVEHPVISATINMPLVPMLELDDGTQLGEALSIWLYLETLHPNPPLMGTDRTGKGGISAWERRAYDEGMVGHAEIFRNSHPRFVDRGLPGHVGPGPTNPCAD